MWIRSGARAALVIFWLTTVGLFSCTTTGEPTAPASRSVTIMTFNVENLFDSSHDEGKNDYTYLPLAEKSTEQHQAQCAAVEVSRWRDECLNLDWSEQVLVRKLNAVAASILANGDNGRGPDIVVLQEVENRAVLERLRRDHLAPAGYGPAIHIEGSDARGIDVAFLSRLPVRGKPVQHATRFTDIDKKTEKDTRGILEATFVLPDGALLTGYAVHFPAPFHPAALRVQSYVSLASLLHNLPANRPAFAAGDFNTIAAERWILDQHTARDWTIAHLAGCNECRGTHYYARNDDWSFLDMILVNPVLTNGATNGWALEKSATRVANAWPQQSTSSGTPQRFNGATGQGVSDHWPLKIRLQQIRK